MNEHDLSAVDGRELEMSVQKVFIHPGFNHQTVDNDIALLRLPRPVKTPPACMPRTRPNTKELCTIMGWGKLNSKDNYGTSRLHEAKVSMSYPTFISIATIDTKICSSLAQQQICFETFFSYRRSKVTFYMLS